jgi:hypothetical protein
MEGEVRAGTLGAGHASEYESTPAAARLDGLFESPPAGLTSRGNLTANGELRATGEPKNFSLLQEEGGTLSVTGWSLRGEANAKRTGR